MKQFDREVIAREEDAQYRLLLSKPRQYWIDLYLKEVRPNYEPLQFWKHRETVADESMPVDAKRIYIKARDGYDLPELIYRPAGQGRTRDQRPRVPPLPGRGRGAGHQPGSPAGPRVAIPLRPRGLL